METSLSPVEAPLAVTPLSLHAKIDQLESAMIEYAPPVATEALHHFFPGLYCREFHAPAITTNNGVAMNTVITSKIHRTEHPFVLLEGRCLVLQDDGGWQDVRAPYFGRTRPGTRRVLVVLEDIRWITFHPTEETDVDKIEQKIIEPHTPGRAMERLAA